MAAAVHACDDDPDVERGDRWLRFAFFTALTAAPAGVIIGAGVAVATVSVWLHLRYQTGAHLRAANEREILYPTTPSAGEHERES